MKEKFSNMGEGYHIMGVGVHEILIRGVKLDKEYSQLNDFLLNFNQEGIK